MKILVLNAGSSSLKFELFSTKNKTVESLFESQLDNHGKPIDDFNEAVKSSLEILIREKVIKNIDEINAIGHRVVHGGEKYTEPTLINPKVIAEIEKVSHLAPLHNPPNLACIHVCKKMFPGLKQVAVFDTSFHQTMPEKAFLYGLPYYLYKKFRIRKYGFHGTSHSYVFEQARKKLGTAKTRRTITCHLGNGASIAAIKNGKVIDTSMGFTPLEGIPMGTRCGDIDPAIIFYLREQNFTDNEIFKMLNKESGLLGISEISSDVRDLWAKYQKRNEAAVRTLQLFAYRIAKYIGSYAAALGGVDCIVFTGGIGENAFYLRKWILGYIKPFLNPKVLVIHTDEEKKIAQETLRVAFS
ncbi:MAG: acetate kinase [Candidatus Gracilibacteria bacterium]